MPREKTSDALTETMIDIAFNAGCMAERGQITVADSREFVKTVRVLAGEFEKTYDQDGDYIAAVDAFAEKKLTELYGFEENKANNG